MLQGGVFSEPSFFSGPCPADPIRAHTRPGITQGLCGWLGASGTQDLRALRLWKSSRQWCAPAVELHGCCTRTSLAEALLRQHIDGVARASSVSNESGSRARSLVLLTMLAPVSRCATGADARLYTQVNLLTPTSNPNLLTLP